MNRGSQFNHYLRETAVVDVFAVGIVFREGQGNVYELFMDSEKKQIDIRF